MEIALADLTECKVINHQDQLEKVVDVDAAEQDPNKKNINPS